MCVSVCLSAIIRPIFGTTCPIFTNFLCTVPMAVARSSSRVVVICYALPFFVDDVIFALKPRLLDVAAQLKRSAHATLGLAINGAQ